MGIGRGIAGTRRVGMGAIRLPFGFGAPILPRARPVTQGAWLPCKHMYHADPSGPRHTTWVGPPVVSFEIFPHIKRGPMRSLVLLAGLGLTTGCAAMFSGTKETIHVRSEQPDTRFFLNERDLGRGQSAATTIPKKHLGRAVLRAEKEGCSARTAPIATSFNGVTLLGLLLDAGVVSILVVDWLATGAVTKAAQTDYVLSPDCPKGTGALGWSPTHDLS